MCIINIHEDTYVWNICMHHKLNGRRRDRERCRLVHVNLKKKNHFCGTLEGITENSSTLENNWTWIRTQLIGPVIWSEMSAINLHACQTTCILLHQSKNAGKLRHTYLVRTYLAWSLITICTEFSWNHYINVGNSRRGISIILRHLTRNTSG